MIQPYTDEIQQLVDSLATRILRSVAVDDQRGGLVASTRHFGDEDKIRVDVVMSRRLPDRAAEYLNSFGIAAADEPLSIPASPALGLKARRCYPIRDHGRLLGYLWLIDEQAERFDKVVQECVVQLSARLRERIHHMADEEKRQRALTAALLRSGDDSARAAAELVERGYLAAADHIVVLTVGGEVEPETIAETVTQATDPFADGKPPVQVLPTVIEDRSVVLVAGPGEEVERGAAWLADAIRRGPRRQRPRSDRDVIVGLSNSDRPDQAPALFRQAVLAAFAAADLPELPPVLSWRDTGIYGPLMLAALAAPELAVPTEIAALKAGARTDSLLHTAEVFLDAAGDTAAASERLMIHRTTLYYRLAQVENRTGRDLKNGHDRLLLHLGLKMQRLIDSGIPALLQGEESHRRSS